MFAVIYRFDVEKGKETQFIKAWAALTKLIYQYEGTLGSRLHKESESVYIAYAQWSSRDKWENSGSQLPELAVSVKNSMREACRKVEKVYELHCVHDLLVAL